MAADEGRKNSVYNYSGEGFTVQLLEPMLHDRLRTLSAEYSVPVELLVSAAVKRLLDDVDFVRGLRAGRNQERIEALD